MTTAVIYYSKTGKTKAAAEYIASKLNAELVIADASVDVSKYDKVIIGTGVYAGKPAKAMSAFIEANKRKLSSASLFVTCLYSDEKGAKQLEKLAESFGIADAIFFNKVKKQIGVPGSKLEDYISTLM